MPETEPGDLSDKAVLFQAYVDLINSERETIWAPHNALLVANSLIVGAIAISPTALWSHRWAALGLLGAGFLITIIWLLITIHGWLVLQRHVELASAFAMTHFRHWANPFSQTAYRVGDVDPHAGFDADRGFRVDLSRPRLFPPDRRRMISGGRRRGSCARLWRRHARSSPRSDGQRR